MTRNAPAYRALARDDGGSVLTVWALALGVFLGLVALSYDFGRLATTQSDLQAFADNVALAAAGELDAQDDAIERATVAAATFISDYQTFGDGDNLLSGAGDFELTFYADRPNDAGTVAATTDPNKAGFVEVVVTNQSMTPIFGAAFSALTGQAEQDVDAAASAVAGFTNYACGITPLMVCVPSPDFVADEHIGETIHLRSGGPEAGWGPGAFGWVDVSAGIVDIDGACAGLTGNVLDICLIAADTNRTTCMAQNGINIQGGQRVGNFEAAINVLFDIYAGSAMQLRNDALYAPAANVRGSFVSTNGNKCVGSAATIATDRMGLPPDDCQVSGTCGRFGDGNWSDGRAAYVAMNYGLVDPFPTAVTRHDYYQAELAAMAALPQGGNLTPLEEALARGLPQCSPHVSADLERRSMIVAGVDCAASDLSAGSTNLEVTEFIEIFLISPAGQEGNFDIYVEIVGNAGAGSGGSAEESIFRDVVVLYD